MFALANLILADRPCALAIYLTAAFAFNKAGIIVEDAKFPAPIIPIFPCPAAKQFSGKGTILSI